MIRFVAHVVFGGLCIAAVAFGAALALLPGIHMAGRVVVVVLAAVVAGGSYLAARATRESGSGSQKYARYGYQRGY